MSVGCADDYRDCTYLNQYNGFIGAFCKRETKGGYNRTIGFVINWVTPPYDPDDIFDGFANPAIITVWVVYIVSGGLFKTGVANSIGRGILRFSGNRESHLIPTIMVAYGVILAFMNNVGATAMLMPAEVGIARRTR